MKQYLFAIIGVAIFSCKNQHRETKPINENIIPNQIHDQANSVQIGNQIWMNQNLNVSTFSNGDIIPEAKTINEWLLASKNNSPAWCYYNNDSSNGWKYGKLYNWYAVNDSRGLAPLGWHIPNESEWNSLIIFLGGEDISGLKMKHTEGWHQNGINVNDGNGNNVSGFCGLPGGARDWKDFIYLGYRGIWWSKDEYFTDHPAAYVHYLLYYDYSCITQTDNKGQGYSVRCIKNLGD